MVVPPGADIVAEARGRAAVYWSDWTDGWNAGTRIFAPSTYIFLASLLPALSFGLQLDNETDGTLGVVQVLAATAMAGVLQAVIGGQPLLIVGVAEPIVIIYSFMHKFADGQERLGRRLFVPWAAWVCAWTAVMCAFIAAGGLSRLTRTFTRFSGEVFGALIAVLFMQQAIKGLIENFRPDTLDDVDGTTAAPPPGSSSSSNEDSAWLLVNGLWGLLLAGGLVLTSLLVVTARGWRFTRGWARSLLADYGPPLMVIVWTGVSFAIAGAPAGVPRRVATGDVWSTPAVSWTMAGQMSEVPGEYIAAALVPAVAITILFFFDHNVSSLMAQQPEYNMTKPSAYNYDMLLLSAMTLMCGLIGLPPINGVLPQAPMHTRSLASLKGRLNQRAATKAARAGGLQQAAGAADSKAGAGLAPAVVVDMAGADGVESEPQLYGDIGPGTGQAHDGGDGLLSNGSVGAGVHLHRCVAGAGVAREASASPSSAAAEGTSAAAGPVQGGSGIDAPLAAGQRPAPPAGLGAADPAAPEPGCPVPLPALVAGADNHKAGGDGLPRPCHEEQGQQAVPLQVLEQRVSNLLQSLAVAASLFATPAIRQIPQAVLWGYFAFMAIESVEGSQFWNRLLLLVTDPARRSALLRGAHAPFLETCPFRVVAWFTLLQLACLVGLWALVTWAGIAGIAFPVFIMLMVPLRMYLLPRIFSAAHLWDLDAAEYEEAPPLGEGELQQGGAGAAAGQQPQGPQQQEDVVAAVVVLGPGAAEALGRASTAADDERGIIEQENARGRSGQVVHHVTRGQLRNRVARRSSSAADDDSSAAAAGGSGGGGVT